MNWRGGIPSAVCLTSVRSAPPQHQMDPSSNFSNYRTALRGATQRSETAHSSQEKVRQQTDSLEVWGGGDSRGRRRSD